MIASGFYYVLSPIAGMFGVLLLCALVVYVFIPCCARLGIYFNDVAKGQMKRSKAIRQLQDPLGPVLPAHGLCWEDVQAGVSWSLCAGQVCRGIVFKMRAVCLERFLELLGAWKESGAFDKHPVWVLEQAAGDPERFILGA